jgi:hypothetical protein
LAKRRMSHCLNDKKLTQKKSVQKKEEKKRPKKNLSEWTPPKLFKALKGEILTMKLGKKRKKHALFHKLKPNQKKKT